MKASADISYYPLNEEYVPPIHEFIVRLNTHEGLTVRTNGMSTQVFGDYDIMMNALVKEIRQSFNHPHSVFVMKIVNADLNTNESG
jgi:uncharacterized protein YqgV (UPF0045/DUF77 family)